MPTPIADLPTSHRQAILPSSVGDSFVGDDTDNHDFAVEGRGKGRFTLAIDNQPDQIVTATLYGTHSKTGAVADAWTFPIDTFTVAAASKGYETCNDCFPFYLVRLAYAVSPTDTPKKNCTLYANFSAF